METWLLLTAYRKSPAPYQTVPTPTPYDLPFSHNTTRLAYFVTFQSHSRSMILMLFDSQYATSY